MWLYFEFAVHPIIRMKYTENDDKTKNNNNECLLSNIGKLLNVIIGMIMIEIRSNSIGLIYTMERFIVSDEIKLLLKSLIASLKGCRIPINPTLFGPFRI